MRKLTILFLLCAMLLGLLSPAEVRAAIELNRLADYQAQSGSEYPIVTTAASESPYPIRTQPPTAVFGTPYYTRTHTPVGPTSFLTATSGYRNTSVAILTGNALTLAALSVTPLPEGSPTGTYFPSETPTETGTSMPSWTPTETLTPFPSMQVSPRVLIKESKPAARSNTSLLIGLGTLALLSLIATAFWFFFRKR